MDIYTFSIEEEPVGIYGCHEGEEIISMNAIFAPDGAVIENPFDLRRNGGRLLAYRAGGGTWVDTTDWPENRYPTSAYPLLIPSLDDHLEYEAINEGSGESLGLTILRRDEDQVTEMRQDRPTRIFLFDEDPWPPVKIDWMGGVSRLVRDPEQVYEDLPDATVDEVRERFEKWQSSVTHSS